MSGQEAFDSWKRRRVPHHPGVVYRRMNITTVCGEQNTELHEIIKDSNLSYFFVFQNHQRTYTVYIHFNLSIERYEYLPDNRINDKYVDHLKQECNLDNIIFLHHNYTAMVKSRRRQQLRGI